MPVRVEFAFLFALLAWMGAGGALRAQEAEPIPGDEVVKLRVFEVRDTADLPPREHWRYGTISGMEILSNASDKVTQEWVEDLQTAVRAGELVWPVKLSTNRPLAFILCRDEAAFEDFGSKEYILKNTNFTHVTFDEAMDWEHGIHIRQAIRWNGIAERWKRALTPAYHTRLVQLEPRPSGWMRGVMYHVLYTATSVENDRLIWGRMTDGFREDSLRRPERRDLAEAFKGAIARNKNRVVVKDGHNKFHDSSSGGNFIYVENFALMCMLHEKGKYKPAFLKFMNRARLEPVTEELFEQCFGKNIEQLAQEVDYFKARVKNSSAPVEFIPANFHYEPLVLRDATDAEVGRIKGEALALLENPKIPPRAMLRAPYVRGERDPKLLAAIGLHEIRLGNEKEARRFLGEAIQAKVERPRAYLELARLDYQQGLKTPGAADGKLSGEQLQPILGLLETALGVAPKIPEVYDLIAEACAHTEPSAMRGHLKTIAEGLQNFPYHAELFCQGAAAFAQAGHTQEAAKLIEVGLARFRYYEPHYRERLERLRATLPAPAKANG